MLPDVRSPTLQLVLRRDKLLCEDRRRRSIGLGRTRRRLRRLDGDSVIVEKEGFFSRCARPSSPVAGGDGITPARRPSGA